MLVDSGTTFEAVSIGTLDQQGPQPGARYRIAEVTGHLLDIIPHLILTAAIIFEIVYRVVLQCYTDHFMRVTKLRSNI